MTESFDKDTKTSEPEDSETIQKTVKMSRPFQKLSGLLPPQIFFGALLAYAGIAVIVFFYYLKSDYSFYMILQRYGPLIVGGLLIGAGFYFTYSGMSKNRLRSERFIDVDAKTRSDSSAVPYIQLIEKIAALEESSKANIQEIISRFKADQTQTIGKETDSFVQYFDSLRKLFEQKAAIADEKASILLDKGTGYSRFGIVFFIFAIVTWQVLAHINGFQTQYIYGIASCSLLFIFIEFLSAWFLKQYQQFIDTSTYLIKVKSIFDKYMLVYLTAKEAVALGHDTKKSTIQLIELLKEDIKWPESYLTKNPDISFAKEALETMSLLVKNMKSEVKTVSTRSRSKSGSIK
jgi:hypothetical protein